MSCPDEPRRAAQGCKCKLQQPIEPVLSLAAQDSRQFHLHGLPGSLLAALRCGLEGGSLLRHQLQLLTGCHILLPQSLLILLTDCMQISRFEAVSYGKIHTLPCFHCICQPTLSDSRNSVSISLRSACVRVTSSCSVAWFSCCCSA